MGFPFHLTQLPNATKEIKNTKNTLFVIYSQENENQTLSIRKISKKTFSYSNHVHSWIFLLQFDQICLHSKFSLQYLKRCTPHPTSYHGHQLIIYIIWSYLSLFCSRIKISYIIFLHI